MLTLPKMPVAGFSSAYELYCSAQNMAMPWWVSAKERLKTGSQRPDDMLV